MKRVIKIIVWIISGIVGLFVVFMIALMFVFPMRSEKQRQPPLSDQEIGYFEHLQKKYDLQNCERYVQNIERISPMADTTQEFYYSIELYAKDSDILQNIDLEKYSLEIANNIKDSLYNSSKNLTEIIVHWKYIDRSKGVEPYESFLFVCDTITNTMILE